MAIVHANAQTFPQEVLQSNETVLVDFWAPWCKYCRRIAPVIERVAQQYEGKVVVAQCNVDDAPALAQQFKVDIIPSLFVIKNGVPGEKIVNPASQDALEAWMMPQL